MLYFDWLKATARFTLTKRAASVTVMEKQGVLASTLLNAKIKNGTPYGLVDLTDTRKRRPL